MNMTYVTKIQANIKRNQKVTTRKNSSGALDGSYKSIVKGRSMNFDDLREYVQGDDVKDIDWKATARSGKTLVREYIAEKKHNVMLILDTNMTMLGHSDGLEEKRELAIMSAGTLAYFVIKNGDYVSAVYAGDEDVKFFPFKSELGALEYVLESYHDDTKITNHSDINKTIDYVIKNFKRKMIVVIVTDIRGYKSITDQNLKRLLVAHDVLALNISDALPVKRGTYNMAEGRMLPRFMAGSKKLINKMKENKSALEKETTDRLKKYGISCSTIDYIDELDKEIIDLLAKHRLERVKF